MSDLTKLKEGLDLLSRQNDTSQRFRRESFHETNELLKSIKSSLFCTNVLIFILVVSVLVLHW